MSENYFTNTIWYKENTRLYQRFAWRVSYYFKRVIKFANRDACLYSVVFVFSVVGLLLLLGIIPDMARQIQ